MSPWLMGLAVFAAAQDLGVGGSGSAGSEPPVSEASVSESSASESTASESIASESTGSESTGSESTASESSASESTASAEAKVADAEEAAAALELCLSRDDAGSDSFRRCLEDLRVQHAGTPAAEQAAGALRLLSRLPPPAQETDANQPLPATPIVNATANSFLTAGRLEMAGTVGTYGLAAGAAAGALAVTNQVGDGSLQVLLTGGAIVVGTAGFGALGYALATWLELDLQHVWAVLGGALWGGSYSISLLPLLYAAFPGAPGKPTWGRDGHFDELTLLVPLVGTAAGMSASFALALVLDPTTAEVSEVNTGGLIGAPFGALLALNLILWRQQASPSALETALIFSSCYGAVMTAGLLAGAASSQILDLTWGEVLVQDFGAFLGMVALTAPTFALLVSPLGERLTTRSGIGWLSAAAVVGTSAGLVATTGALATWRHYNGEPVLRDVELPFLSSLVVAPTLLVDRRDEVAPALGLSLVF